MPQPLTQQEWTTIIHDAIPSFLPPRPLSPPSPPPPSSSFSSFSYSPAASMIAQTIDHTLLRLDATESQIDALCAEAIQYKFKSVCVRVGWVSRCVENLRGDGEGEGVDVSVCCVIGFHEGTYSIEEKVKEAQTAISHGATELDLVLNHHLLHANADNNNPNYPAIYAEILAIRTLPTPTTAAAADHQPITLKVILETSQLSPPEIISACILASYARVDFVKTSTGFCGRGASVEDVLLMKTVVDKMYVKEEGEEEEEEEEGGGGRGGGGEKNNKKRMNKVKVKASGGVKGLGDWKRMINAGAERVGTSAGVAIMREAQREVEEGRGG